MRRPAGLICRKTSGFVEGLGGGAGLGVEPGRLGELRGPSAMHERPVDHHLLGSRASSLRHFQSAHPPTPTPDSSNCSLCVGFNLFVFLCGPDHR
jgi:hypothetical protein